MNVPAQRRLRADAARNVERIVLSAREIFAEQGVDAQLSDVAQRAGVGEATLYRHFANKEDLIRAVVGRRFDEDVHPVILRALRNPDPWQAMVAMLEIYMEMATHEKGALATARDPAIVERASQYFESFAVVLQRAQDAGVVRADLLPEDLPRLTNMLIGAQRLGSDPEVIGTPVRQ
jgi:AcrR family transcriptional regulator